MPSSRRTGRAYLIGGGISALAAAAYLIRDAKLPGQAIRIFDECADLGGSLDAQGSPQTGYRLRGGRMFNSSYFCTYDLLSFIPSLTNPALTVLEEIRSFNRDHPTAAKARLIENGRAVDVCAMQFSARDRVDLIEMALRSEDSLSGKRIDECFEAHFFTTNFWFMWATTFGFSPWHSAGEFKRYLHPFIAEFSRMDTLAGVERTPFNQYDSIVRPLARWLEARGVSFELEARIEGITFAGAGTALTATGLRCLWSGTEQTIIVNPDDCVIATLGSMTAGSSWGSMDAPAIASPGNARGSWELWEELAAEQPALGYPRVFSSRTAESTWISFTLTFADRERFDRLQRFMGTALATFKDSNWLLSLVFAHQPHFVGQPADVGVAWGYGLFVEREGNFVKKRMRDCSGEEIMREVLGHLHRSGDTQATIDSTICLPCLMPFITSQFSARAKGDRPPVIPRGSTNLALIGQYVEIPHETVFTVEYSVRAAQLAVFGLFDLAAKPTPVFDRARDGAILQATLETLLT